MIRQLPSCYTFDITFGYNFFDLNSYRQDWATKYNYFWIKFFVLWISIACGSGNWRDWQESKRSRMYFKGWWNSYLRANNAINQIIIISLQTTNFNKITKVCQQQIIYAPLSAHLMRPLLSAANLFHTYHI